MALVIDLITSSSPQSAKISSFKSSPLSQQFKDALSINEEKSTANITNSKLSQSISVEDAEYEKFKLNWRKNRIQPSSDFSSNESSPNLTRHAKRRRTSDSFTITPIQDKFNSSFTVNNSTLPKLNFGSLLAAKEAVNRKRFKNKGEAINSIRIFMSPAMAEAYGAELERRSKERSMTECVAVDISSTLIPAEVASFRWKFADSTEFLEPRLFILDSESLWEDFIAPKRFRQLLSAYNEPKVFLYFMNWKRAAQKHTSALNKQFKNALNTSSETVRLVPANELENEFFLIAADLRLQINFGNASTAPQAIVDLMDFVIEMTRVVALDGHLKESKERRPDQQSQLNITLARDVKVKCGKDGRDCWVKSLCQIPRVTRPLADVIVTRYPSFGVLMEAYAACRCDQERSNLLSDLRLDEHLGAGNGNRRLGPVISARIYNHFFQD